MNRTIHISILALVLSISIGMLLLLLPYSLIGQVVIYKEGFGSGLDGSSIPVSDYNEWDNVDPIAYAGNAEVRVTFPSSLPGASGEANVHFAYNSEVKEFYISGINTLGYTDLSFSFLHYKRMNELSTELVVEISEDGINWNALNYYRPSGAGTSNWYKVEIDENIPSAENVRIKFWKNPTTGVNSYFRIDDIIIRGTPISDPIAGTILGAQSICIGETPSPLTLTEYEGEIQWESSTDGSNWSPAGVVNSDELVLGPLIQTTFYRAAVSIGANTVFTEPIKVTVNPTVNVAVTISADPPGAVCDGTLVTYTASSVTPGNLIFEWHVGVNSQGINDDTFYHTPAEGDVVYVTVSTDEACPDSPQIESNRITTTINPVIETSVSLGVSANPVCEGDMVLFTATPFNGGTPSYQWFRNGESVPDANEPEFSFMPSDEETVYVKMFSSLDCAVPATSGEIIIQVTPRIQPEFTFNNQWCEGDNPPELPIVSNDGLITGEWNFNPDDPKYQPGSVPYIITFTPDQGQCSEQAEAEIYILERKYPEFSIGPLCQGSGLFILRDTSDNGITGSWFPQQVDTDATTLPQYYFTPDYGQCAESFRLDVSLVASIIPEFNIPTIFCLGDTPPDLPLVSDNDKAISGTWSPPEISTISAGPATYIFTPDASQACVTMYEFEITVNGLPVVNCPEPLVKCLNHDSFALDMAVPAGGVYYLDGNPITAFDPVVYGVDDHTITYEIENAYGCTSTCSFVIRVYALPTADAGPDQTIDYGTSTMLSGSAPGVFDPQFNWLPTAYIADPYNIANPQTVPLLENRLFMFTVTDANGCTNSDQVWIRVDGSELTAAPYADKDVICLGDTVQLFAEASGGVGEISYRWYFEYQGSGVPAEFLSDVANPLHTPLYENHVTYSLQVEDGGGSLIEREDMVLVNPLPVLPHYEDYSFCANDDIIQLTDHIPITGGMLTINGDIEPNFQAVADGGTGDYDIVFTKTDANTGCSNSDDFTITIRPVPAADVGAEMIEVPYGKSVTLDGASVIPVGSETLVFSWSPDSLFVNNTVLEPTTIPLTSSAQLTLMVTEDGCSHNDQLQLNVVGEPLTAQPVALPESICPGEPVTLRAQPSGGFGEYTYLWTSDRGDFTSNKENPPPVSPEATTVYSLEVRDEVSNIAVESVTLTVFEPPELLCPEPLIIPENEVIQPLPDILPAEGNFLLDDQEISVIDPEALGVGSHNVFYMYEYGGECLTECSFLVKVTSSQQYTLNLTVSPTGKGSVTGARSYSAGETVWISAEYNRSSGYGFHYWTGDVIVNDSLAASTSFTMPDHDVDLTAIFRYIEFPIIIKIFGLGYVASAEYGEFYAPGDTVYIPLNQGEFFTFHPNPGETVRNVILNGDSLGSRLNYLFDAVKREHILEVIFSGSQRYTLRYLAGVGGDIEGDDQQTVNQGENGTQVMAVPIDGYDFLRWSDGRTDNPRTDVNVTADISVTARFAINTYTITATAGVGGTIFPTGELVVAHGDSQTYHIVPDEGYHVLDVVVDGLSQGAISEWEFKFIASDHTIDALFGINTYTITAAANIGGTIWPIGELVVEHGDSQKYTIMRDESHHILDVLVDGVSQGAISEFTFTNITRSHAIEALFAINTYQLTYIAEQGGDIIGEKEQMVQHGGSGSEVIADPDDGYSFAGWSDDNPDPQRTDVGVIQSQTFTALFTQNRYTLTYQAGPGGSIIGPDSQPVLYGEDGREVEAVPDRGYVFVSWNDGNRLPKRIDKGITEHMAFTATFSLQGFWLIFNVNMSYAGQYNEASDEVFVTGSMFNYTEPGSRPTEQRLFPAPADPKRLTNSVNLPAGRYYYKYFLNNGWDGEEWLGAPVRMVEIKDSDVVVFDYFGNTDDPTTVHLPEEQSFIAYPNPARHTLTVISDTSEPLRYLRLFNMLGQPVYLDDATDQTQVMIDVSQFIPGLYFVQVLTVRGWKTAKILISP